MSVLSPLQRVKTDHGDKSKLIEALLPLLERPEGESEDEFKNRLKLLPNRKLLRLERIGKQAAEWGGRKAIVKRITDARGQSKDHEFTDALAKLPLGRLLDMVRSTEARAQGKVGKAVPRRQRRQRRHGR